MPVYITNRMYLPQDGVERVLAYVGGTEPLDFNTVQPMPRDLTGQEGRDWRSAFWGSRCWRPDGSVCWKAFSSACLA